MLKFIDHVDHVAWISRIENIEKNAEMISKLCNVELDGPFVPEGLGLTIYMSWAAGLEIAAPHNEVTKYNRPLHDRLEARGEGMWAVIFGVKNIEEARQRAEAMGFTPSPVIGESEQSPWAGSVLVKESRATEFLGTWLIFGEISYRDGLVKIEHHD